MHKAVDVANDGVKIALYHHQPRLTNVYNLLASLEGGGGGGKLTFFHTLNRSYLTRGVGLHVYVYVHTMDACFHQLTTYIVQYMRRN